MKRSNFVKIYLTGFILILFDILILLLLVNFESNYPDSSIKSFSDALWYSIVTLTTVGYGDYYPISFWGKIIGYFYVLASLGILGFLIGKLTETLTIIRENKKMGLLGTKFSNHIIIIGWNDFIQSIVEQLIAVNKKIAIIINDKNKIDLIYNNYNKKNIFVLFSDYKNFDQMNKVNIQTSSILFLHLDSDTEQLVYYVNLKKEFPMIKTITVLDNSTLVETFKNAGVNHVLAKNEIASKLVASYIFEPDVAEFAEDLLASAVSQDDYDIKQFKVLEQNPFQNSLFKDAFVKIKLQYNSILIGVSRNESNKRIIYKNPDDQFRILVGDYLILITNGKDSIKLQKHFEIDEGI